MTAILYSPAEDLIYEWDGWDLHTRVYTDGGGFEDETGAKYYLQSLECYGSYQDFGLIKIDTLE